MVPKGWTAGRVEDLLNGLESGVSVNGEDRQLLDGEKGVLKVSAVTYGTFNPHAVKVIEREDELDRAKINPRKSQIIISRSNTESLVGASAYINSDYPELFLPDKLWQTIPKPDANMKWLSYVLSSEPVRYTLSNLATGTSGSMKNITKGEFLSLKISIPPLAEQQKIAKILSTWDKAISTTERLIDNSTQQKKALMQQLLTGKKRLLSTKSGFSVRDGFAKSKLGELPDDWNLSLIPKFYWFQEGPGVRKHQFTETGVKLLNGTNIQKSRVDLTTTKTHISEDEAYGGYKHFLADSGDLIIACSGISVDRFDEKIAFLEDCHLPLCMNTSTMRFKVKKDVNASLEFLRYFMMSPLFKNQIRRQITGSAQLNFGPSHVEKCYIALPSYDEQQRIAAVLTNADKEIDLLEQQLADLQQEKKALMQVLLTGKVRVLF